MGGTTCICPSCGIIFRVHSMQLSGYNREAPFVVKEDGKVKCRFCGSEPVHLTKMAEVEAKMPFKAIYTDRKVLELIKQKQYTEAIGLTHSYVSHELRSGLFYRVSLAFMIPDNSEDMRYKRLMAHCFKSLNDATLLELASIFGLVTEKEFGILTQLNSLRNSFLHSLKDRNKKWKPDQVEKIITASIKAEDAISFRMREDYFEHSIIANKSFEDKCNETSRKLGTLKTKEKSK